MLSTVAAVGSNTVQPCSWKLESSSTQVCGKALVSSRSPSVSSSVGPMLPATATVWPARCSNWPVSEVTVVLPFVPVMARM